MWAGKGKRAHPEAQLVAGVRGAIPLDPEKVRKAEGHEIAEEFIEYHNGEIFETKD